ncbi:MAG: LysR family transcriptional regulator [Albidovulum sp.]
MRDNWDDLRYVLAVADEGSVSGAARRLGVNHATVLRRVAAYEETAGVTLFDKTAKGYAVPGAQKHIIEAAREVDRAVQAVGRILLGLRAPVSGEVRITSTDTFCQNVLPGIITQLRSHAPDLKIELLSTNAHLDMARTRADITVRPAIRLPEDLTGSVATVMGFGLFRAKASDTEAWLGVSGPLERSLVGRWLVENTDPRQFAAAADSFPVLREMAACGQGMAILPLVLGANDKRLERVAGILPEIEVPLWVASHIDLADVPRIAETRRALTAALSALDAWVRYGIVTGPDTDTDVTEVASANSDRG